MGIRLRLTAELGGMKVREDVVLSGALIGKSDEENAEALRAAWAALGPDEEDAILDKLARNFLLGRAACDAEVPGFTEGEGDADGI